MYFLCTVLVKRVQVLICLRLFVCVKTTAVDSPWVPEINLRVCNMINWIGKWGEKNTLSSATKLLFPDFSLTFNLF